MYTYNHTRRTQLSSSDIDTLAEPLSVNLRGRMHCFQSGLPRPSGWAHEVTKGDLHPEPHAHAEITLGRRRSEGAVGGENTVVHEPGGSVELREEGLDAPAEAVLGVRNSLENGGTNDGLD